MRASAFVRNLLLALLIGTLLGGCWSDGDDSTAPPSQQTTLPRDLLVAFGADPNKQDTDGDGLTDDYEIRYGYPFLKPDKADTNGDGRADGSEDSDGDGLTNAQEQAAGTSPIQADTDLDGLSDAAEISTHKTDPLKADTDGDGISDGREVANGSNPLQPDADRVVKSTTAAETVNIVTGVRERVLVTVEGPGDLGSRISVNSAADVKVPGQLGRRFDIAADDAVRQKMLGADITLPYDSSLAEAADASQVAVFTINPATGFWEELPTTVDPVSKTVTAHTAHFSPFMVANKVIFQDSLSKLAQTCDLVSDPNAIPADVVLVIDSSGSMLSNDPQNLRISAARSFVAGMKTTDRVAVVDFDSSARLAIGLSADQSAISAAIGTIDSSGGTDIGAGVSIGINVLSQGSDVNKNRVIILLTDGEGAYSSTLTQSMVTQGIRAFTIGLTGGVNTALLQGIATATQGAYKQLNDASGLVGIFTEFASVFGDTGVDSDEDGLSDCQEIQGVYATALSVVVRTDPKNRDTDGDGILDGAELGPLAKTSVNSKTPWTAPGYSDPSAGKADTDGDGISDPEEFRLGTNPLAQDTDSDGLSDIDEVSTHGTNALVADTDDDGMDDATELARRAEGFDPLVYDYRVNSSFRLEVFKGFVAGDLITIDTTPELIGQILSGVAVFGDVRDFLANLFQGEWVGAGVNAIGVIPLVGDAGKAGATAAKFLAKYPNKFFEVVRYVDKYVPGGVAKYLPVPPAKVAAAWALNAFERGREIERIVAPSIPGKALLGNYPKIDVFDMATGRAVSIKSLDLDAKTYQSVQGFGRTIDRYAKSLAEFRGANAKKLADGTVFPSLTEADIRSRELLLVVPRELSAEYAAAANAAAAARGVQLRVQVLP